MTAIQMADADLCITPNLSTFNLIDFGQIPDIIEAGYQTAFPALKTWIDAKR